MEDTTTGHNGAWVGIHTSPQETVFRSLISRLSVRLLRGIPKISVSGCAGFAGRVEIVDESALDRCRAAVLETVAADQSFIGHLSDERNLAPFLLHFEEKRRDGYFARDWTRSCCGANGNSEVGPFDGLLALLHEEDKAFAIAATVVLGFSAPASGHVERPFFFAMFRRDCRWRNQDLHAGVVVIGLLGDREPGRRCDQSKDCNSRDQCLQRFAHLTDLPSAALDCDEVSRASMACQTCGLSHHWGIFVLARSPRCLYVASNVPIAKLYLPHRAAGGVNLAQQLSSRLFAHPGARQGHAYPH